MINIITFIAGIVLVVGIIASFISSIGGTPDNLRGFYGGFYAIISVFGLIGDIGMILFSFMI